MIVPSSPPATVPVADIVRLLELPPHAVLGDTRRTVDGLAPILEAGPTHLAFCAPEKPNATDLVGRSGAGVILCPESVDFGVVRRADRTLLRLADPRRAAMRVSARFFAAAPPRGIHPTAVIDPTARIGDRVFVGPYSCIGANVVIGDDSAIHGHVSIYGPAHIGRSCIIHAGAVLGADGFGFWRNENGTLEKFPHVGGIVIEDDVEIGANTAIDRGTLGDTRIRRGAKIDNLVHIAHNAEIGEHTTVIAHAIVAGSVRIGARSWVAPGACIRDRVEIGADVTIGMGSVVTRSVVDGETVMGVPARLVSAPRQRPGR